MTENTKIFDDIGDFVAFHKATSFLKERGFSFGSMQSDDPILAMYGNFAISKWRGLSAEEKSNYHVLITGEKRNGPITLTLHENADEQIASAFNKENAENDSTIKSDSLYIQDIAEYAKKAHDAVTPGYFESHVLLVYEEGKKHYDSFMLDAATLLHDIIEDTAVTRDELEKKYGIDIAKIVWRLTDEPGKTRKEKKRKTYWKIRGNEYSLIAKLCDRIVNMRNSVNTSSHHGKMYAKEYYTFKCALWEPDSNKALWKILDDLYDQLKKQ